MEYFYHAVRCICGEDKEFLCRSNEEMKKKEVFASECNGEFFIGTIKDKVDKMDALVEIQSTGEQARSVIIKVPVTEYLKSKENEYKQTVIMMNMNERLKELKAMEALNKYAEKDDNLRSLMNEYKGLQ